MDVAKFEKVVLLLSSDQAGEVFAAAQAIGRALPAANLDWHKFAKLVAGRLGHTPTPSAEPSPRPQSSEASKADREMIALLNGTLRYKLSEKDRWFIDGLYEKCEKYGPRMRLSPAQRKWVQDIWEKVA